MHIFFFENHFLLPYPTPSFVTCQWFDKLNRLAFFRLGIPKIKNHILEHFEP